MFSMSMPHGPVDQWVAAFLAPEYMLRIRQGGCSAPRAGQYALGRTGFWGISALAFTEFFGDSLIVLIVMWQEISALLSPLQGEPHHP